MTPSDVANVKNAALSVLDFYEPAQQWIGMVSLPYGQASNRCVAFGDRRTRPPTFQVYPNPSASTWQAAAMSQGYKRADGSINTSDPLVQQINCLQRAGDFVWAKSDGQPVNGSGQHTNLGDPLDAARAMLAVQGRTDVPDVIIFMTDGQANQPSTRQPCGYFNNKATIAKDAGQTIFTIAYGLDSPPVNCASTDSAQFRSRPATTNLASAATDSIDDVPGGCGPNENRDGDHYFCTPGTSDLEPVFRQVAAAAIETAHLISDD
jgi:hypothetical protein